MCSPCSHAPIPSAPQAPALNTWVSKYLSSVIAIFPFIYSSCKHSTLHTTVNVVKGMFHSYKTHTVNSWQPCMWMLRVGEIGEGRSFLQFFGKADGNWILFWRGSKSWFVQIEPKKLWLQLSQNNLTIVVAQTDADLTVVVSSVRSPAIVRDAGTKFWQFHCKFLVVLQNRNLINMLVVYPGLTLHSITAQQVAFFAYTVFTLCHKNRVQRVICGYMIIPPSDLGQNTRVIIM